MSLPGIRPPTFSGDDSTDVADFVLRLRRYALATQLDDARLVNLLALQVTGTAERWLMTSYPDPDELPDFPELRAALLACFMDATTLDQISGELDRLQQTGSIADYANRFQVLAARLQLDDNDELRRKFARGLKTNGRVQLAMHEPAMLAASIKLATHFELAYRGTTVPVVRANGPSRIPAHPAHDENAMDVDAVATIEAPEELDVAAVRVGGNTRSRDEEHKYCRARGLCFRCKQRGHRSFECPDRLNAQQ
ncbi:hypothetical protein FBU31_002343 [Coemansia sp. 'formosensis']|nr:hypothetical protein FBU31_002343 [Coemansia sp. 'formosensis']